MQIKSRFIRFLLAGSLNTIFGFIIYSLAISLGLPIWGSLLGANIAGVAFNFLTTGYYAFRSLLFAHFSRFAAAYTCIYLSNCLLISILIRWGLAPMLAQAILTPGMVLFSYFLLTKFVFLFISRNPR